MGFVDQIFGGRKKSDSFGIDAAIHGVRSLKQRLADERAKLSVAEDRLRDAALDGGEIDEMPMLRQQARVAAVERALEKALADAGAHLSEAMPKIRERILVLESEQADLVRRRGEALIKLVADFIHATGASLVETPRKGAGGTIGIPAIPLERSEVEALLNEAMDASAPAPSKEEQRLAAVREELRKLEVLKRYSGRTGLETLVG